MGQAPRLRPARLAEKLLQIRLALGLSQNEMIHLLGLTDKLSQNNISAFERGTREPSLPVLLHYARITGLYVDVLIDDRLNLPKKLPITGERERTLRRFNR